MSWPWRAEREELQAKTIGSAQVGEELASLECRRVALGGHSVRRGTTLHYAGWVTELVILSAMIAFERGAGNDQLCICVRAPHLLCGEWIRAR